MFLNQHVVINFDPVFKLGHEFLIFAKDFDVSLFCLKLTFKMQIFILALFYVFVSAVLYVDFVGLFKLRFSIFEIFT